MQSERLNRSISGEISGLSRRVDGFDPHTVRKTQRSVILSHFMAGKSLTSLQAARTYGIVSLPKRICELLEHGHPVKKLRVKFPSGKTGMQYSL